MVDGVGYELWYDQASSHVNWYVHDSSGPSITSPLAAWMATVVAEATSE
jgi:hypothetical protein